MQSDRPTASARIAGALPIVLCAGLLFGCASSVPRPDAIGRGDYDAVRRYASALIQEEIERSGIAGMSIALVDDQKVVWAEGFGYADREGQVPATADTIYRIGSMRSFESSTLCSTRDTTRHPVRLSRGTIFQAKRSA